MCRPGRGRRRSVMNMAPPQHARGDARNQSGQARTLAGVVQAHRGHADEHAPRKQHGLAAAWARQTSDSRQRPIGAQDRPRHTAPRRTGHLRRRQQRQMQVPVMLENSDRHGRSLASLKCPADRSLVYAKPCTAAPPSGRKSSHSPHGRVKAITGHTVKSRPDRIAPRFASNAQLTIIRICIYMIANPASPG